MCARENQCFALILESINIVSMFLSPILIIYDSLYMYHVWSKISTGNVFSELDSIGTPTNGRTQDLRKYFRVILTSGYESKLFCITKTKDP